MSAIDNLTQNYSNIQTTLTTDTGDAKVTVSGVSGYEGLTLDYNLLGAPKQFKIDPTGAHWTNGTNTYDTTLEILASGLQAVVPPPNATTFEVVDTIVTTTVKTDNLNSNASYYINSGKRIYQSLNTYTGYSTTNGYYALANRSCPLPNPASSGVQAVSTWTTRTPAANNEWRSVCWAPELGLFCAISRSGIANRVMTSSNGIAWTIQTSAADNDWLGVCWAPELGLFCAVASSGIGNRVMTSPDGITWSPQTSATDNDWRSVCWAPELGLFCVVASSGTGNRVMTSPDGIAWTSRSSAANNYWGSVCWAPELGLFCAVASTGSGNRVMTSPDGIAWTSRTTIGDTQWTAVCWAPELGLFCAVGQFTAGNRVMTSLDGITWTTQTAVSDSQWTAVCWAPKLGLFCAVAQTASGNRVMTSSLKGRPPTSYNVFNNSNNQIAETGAWTINGTITNATNASNVTISSDNTSGNYYIPFSKTTGTGSKPLFQDDSTGPLSYNPSTATLTTNKITSNGATNLNLTSATTSLVISTTSPFNSDNNLTISASNIILRGSGVVAETAGAATGVYLCLNLDSTGSGSTLYKIRLFAA